MQLRGVVAVGGICGFVAARGRVLPDSKAVLEAMAEAMAHRGGGARSFFHDGRASLGELSWSDHVSNAPGAPLANETGRYRLVCDGSIYNHRQLRQELQRRGHRFKTREEQEVIVHLFEEMGPECASRLRGAFAFALWDGEAETLYLVRDRFGMKPLYYAAASDGALLFASEAKALLKYPRLSTGVNLAALPHYLTFQYFPDPQSAFLGIMRLHPAHHLAWNGGESRLRKYWDIRFRPADKPLSYFVEKASHLIRESVRLHCGEGPLPGAFLSSGIDSSNIAALLSRLGEVNSYSVNCAGGKYDELTPARETAHFLGTRHREALIGPAEFWAKLPHAIWHQDEPVADPAAIALFFAAGLAATEVKAVLSGEGADEAFGGYEIYREPAALAPVQCLPRPVKGLLRRLEGRLPEGMKGKNYLRRATTSLERRYYGNAFIFSEAEKAALLNPDLYGAGWVPPWEITAPYYRKSTGWDAATRMQHLDFHTWLPGDILAKADRMVSAHSLELHLPYLDHVLVEFAATIPPRYKIARGMTKYVLRMSASRYLPGEIYRRPKLGFPVPLAPWIREHFQEQLRELWHSEAARTYFNPAVLEQMLERHCRGEADYARKIWTAAVFLLWHRLYFE